MAGRTCGKCSGTGDYVLASGCPGPCFPCGGTGRITPEDPAAKARQERWGNARQVLMDMPRDYKPWPTAYRFYTVVLEGFDKLTTDEPYRLDALYRSLDAGRHVDVAVALYRYAEGK